MCPAELGVDNGWGLEFVLTCTLASDHIGQHHDPRGVRWTHCLAGHPHQ